MSHTWGVSVSPHESGASGVPTPGAPDRPEAVMHAAHMAAKAVETIRRLPTTGATTATGIPETVTALGKYVRAWDRYVGGGPSLEVVGQERSEIEAISAQLEQLRDRIFRAPREEATRIHAFMRQMEAELASRAAILRQRTQGALTSRVVQAVTMARGQARESLNTLGSLAPALAIGSGLGLLAIVVAALFLLKKGR